MPFDARQLREYRARYDALAAVEAAELRAMTIEQRWQQLNALLRLAHELGLPLGEVDEGEEQVWQRWARLRELYEHSK